MEKIDREKFVKDIEKDLGIKKYEKQIKNDEKKEKSRFDDFNDFGEIFSEFFKNINKEYKPSKLDIEIDCKISREEATIGCEKNLKITRKVFDKKEQRNRKKEIKLKIPKGIKNEQKIIIYGEGNQDKNLNMGNLCVKIIIKK